MRRGDQQPGCEVYTGSVATSPSTLKFNSLSFYNIPNTDVTPCHEMRSESNSVSEGCTADQPL